MLATYLEVNSARIEQVISASYSFKVLGFQAGKLSEPQSEKTLVIQLLDSPEE